MFSEESPYECSFPRDRFRSDSFVEHPHDRPWLDKLYHWAHRGGRVRAIIAIVAMYGVSVYDARKALYSTVSTAVLAATVAALDHKNHGWVGSVVLGLVCCFFLIPFGRVNYDFVMTGSDQHGDPRTFDDFVKPVCAASVIGLPLFGVLSLRLMLGML